MSIYLVGVLSALILFFIIGIVAGRKVKSANDYFVAGRRAPVLLVTGSLIASFLSTGAFLGDTGEVYSGFFMGIVIVGILQATGYIYGAGLFGRYIRRCDITTIPEYFSKRFDSKQLGKLAAFILIISVSAYLLSAIQGVSTVINRITGLNYRTCTVIAWLAFTVFTVYSGSPGVLLTDTIMFLVFLIGSLFAIPFVVRSAGGWYHGIEVLALSKEVPGIISWAGNPDYLYPDGWSNLTWAVTYGLVWALVVCVSPWQTSRYLMARDEHVVMRSSVWSSIGVMVVTVSLYFMAAFIRSVQDGLSGSEAVIWSAMNLLPPFIGVILLTGITAAGLSSASTFLSQIGFSVVNDILSVPVEKDRARLRLSRMSMLAVSLIVLLLAWLNPPQIFWIMYFGGTVIASSWSVSALGSIWCKSFSKTGAYLSMLMGFLGCAGSKILYSLADTVPPIYLDPFFIGFLLSLFGAVLGSFLRRPGQTELARHNAMINPPAVPADPVAQRKDHTLWVVYFGFGLAVMVFFLICYALPFRHAIGI